MTYSFSTHLGSKLIMPCSIKNKKSSKFTQAIYLKEANNYNILQQNLSTLIIS